MRVERQQNAAGSESYSDNFTFAGNNAQPLADTERIAFAIAHPDSRSAIGRVSVDLVFQRGQEYRATGDDQRGYYGQQWRRERTGNNAGEQLHIPVAVLPLPTGVFQLPQCGTDYHRVERFRECELYVSGKGNFFRRVSGCPEREPERSYGDRLGGNQFHIGAIAGGYCDRRHRPDHGELARDRDRSGERHYGAYHPDGRVSEPYVQYRSVQPVPADRMRHSG